jgi:HK97 family phage major capsid protein
MDKKVQKELDNLVEVLDKKIDKRIDTIEVQAKKSSLGFNSHRNSFKHEIQKSLKENKGSDKFEIKAGEMYISQVTGSDPVTPDVTNFKATPFPMDLRIFLNTLTTSSDTIIVNRGVYNANNAASTAEAGAYPESTNTLTATSYNVKKFTHKFQVSDEFLEDIKGSSQFIINQIQGGLISKLNDDIETDILANDTDFAAGAFANAIESANEMDVLLVCLNQLRLANYNPNLVMLSPNDYTKIQVLKSSSNEYLNANRNELFGSNQLGGVQIVVNPSITSGVCHIMDSNSFGAYYVRQPITVQIGYDGSDFSSGTKTAICVNRGVLAPWDTGACVSATFSNAKSALETA